MYLGTYSLASLIILEISHDGNLAQAKTIDTSVVIYSVDLGRSIRL